MPEYTPSDSTPTPPTHSSPSSPKTTKPPAKPSSPAKGNQKPSSWLTLAALVIALIAVALAVIGWFRPTTGPGSFSGQQADDAKKDVCTAVNTVANAVGINTNRPNPSGDQVGGLAVAANANLSLSTGGEFLHDKLTAEPAAPGDLRDAITTYANTLQELSINYLAGASPTSSVQQPLRDNLRTQFGEISKLCEE